MTCKANNPPVHDDHEHWKKKQQHQLILFPFIESEMRVRDREIESERLRVLRLVENKEGYWERVAQLLARWVRDGCSKSQILLRHL
jgi:hypothetical protein